MNDAAGEAHDVNTNTSLEKKPTPVAAVASALSELISVRNGSVYRYIEATSEGQLFKMREWGRGATRLGIAIISLLIIFILSLHPEALRVLDKIKLPFFWGR